jgi:hypothetical protein
VRDSVALLVDFTIGSRGNTSVHLRSGDVQLLRDGLDGHCVRLRALKGKVLVDTLIGDEKVIMFSPDAVEGPVPLIQKWDSWWRELGLDRGGNKKDSWYRLPGEEKTWNWNVNQIMNVFMGEVLLVVGVTTPHSFRYSWHSLRPVTASSCKAINVADSKYGCGLRHVHRSTLPHDASLL